MRMPNVLFITHGPLLYGAQQSLLALLSSIDRRRITPILLSPREGPLTEDARRLGVQVVLSDIEHWVAFGEAAKVSPLKRWIQVVSGMKRRARAIAEIVTRLNIDLVYTNTVTVLEGAIAARIAQVPHVWHLREHVAGNKDLNSLGPDFLIPHIVGALSTQVVVNSQALAKAYACSRLEGKVMTVHNGIDLKLFALQQDARVGLRKELGIPPEARIVAAIGSITPRKGHELFIDVASRLSKTVGGLIFLVVGEGESRRVETLRSWVRQAGLEQAFHFIGWRDDIASILSSIDLLLVTSEQEAFGRTLIEAMAARTPVVATRSGGPEEIIVDGMTGFLVAVNDAEEMTKAAIRILNDRALAARFAAAGAARAGEMFSIESYVGKIESIILQLIQRETASH